MNQVKYKIKWGGPWIETKILTALIHNCVNNYRMNTRKLREYVYGRRSSTGFWKFIGRLEEQGFVKMEPNQIVLTPLGKKTFYEELRRRGDEWERARRKTKWRVRHSE